MLKKILEYQKEEQVKIALEKELSTSKDREIATKLKQILQNQQSDLISLEENAKKYNELFNNAVKKYEEYMEKLAKLEEELKNADIEKSELYEKMFKDFVKVGESLEKNIKAIYLEIQKINKSYEEIIVKSQEHRATFDKHSKIYKTLKQDREPKIQNSKDKLAEFE
ncbi:MAG: hypothetical protein IJX17_04565, partial [Clostridia bacterium]|nr:hypothetical protein [Clostridia bacterium]